MNKFRNVKHGGYDSKKEANRAALLELMQRMGEISNLRTQCVFVLIPSQKESGKVVERALTYRADFTYMDRDGKLVVENVKSAFTRKLPAYVIKRKLMRFLRGITIREV